MKKILFSTVFLTSLFLHLPAYSMQISINAQEVNKVSATRQVYLDKMYILERQLSDIDLKWNWIVVTPEEDSIAKAQGWYEYMGARREQLKADVVRVKIEQVIGYYQDVLRFPVAEENRNTILIPELKLKRSEVAPDYPEHESYLPLSETDNSALAVWLQTFPGQYTALTDYLESLVNQYL
ncbi:MAG: hypothetical protein HYZ14_13585 [Bacteroidetes bacterium]|nr:hypothetical protein [Bacteroidota bacterium]